MSQDIDRVERLEQIVTALAGFVSTMPGAPMTNPALARDRMATILGSEPDQGVAAAG